MLAPPVGLVVPPVGLAALAMLPPAAGPPAEPDAVAGLPLAGFAIMLLGAAVVFMAGLAEPLMPALALWLMLPLPALLVLGALGPVFALLAVAGGSAPPQAHTPSATKGAINVWSE